MRKFAHIAVLFLVLLVGNIAHASSNYFYYPRFGNLTGQATSTVVASSTLIGQPNDYSGTVSGLLGGDTPFFTPTFGYQSAIRYCQAKSLGFVNAFSTIESTTTAQFNANTQRWSQVATQPFFYLIVCDDLATTTVTFNATTSVVVNNLATTTAIMSSGTSPIINVTASSASTSVNFPSNLTASVTGVNDNIWTFILFFALFGAVLFGIIKLLKPLYDGK